jgi:hypothetical protein
MTPAAIQNASRMRSNLILRTAGVGGLEVGLVTNEGELSASFRLISRKELKRKNGDGETAD